MLWLERAFMSGRQLTNEWLINAWQAPEAKLWHMLNLTGWLGARLVCISSGDDQWCCLDTESTQRLCQITLIWTLVCIHVDTNTLTPRWSLVGLKRVCDNGGLCKWNWGLDEKGNDSVDLTQQCCFVFFLLFFCFWVWLHQSFFFLKRNATSSWKTHSSYPFSWSHPSSYTQTLSQKRGILPVYNNTAVNIKTKHKLLIPCNGFVASEPGHDRTLTSITGAKTVIVNTTEWLWFHNTPKTITVSHLKNQDPTCSCLYSVSSKTLIWQWDTKVSYFSYK